MTADRANSGNRNGRLSVAERQDNIALALSRSGYQSIAGLAEMLDVSEMTIRRDLDALAARGLVERAHGGAVARWGNRLDIVEPALEERLGRNATAKARIAGLACDLVGDGQAMALDIGSTTLRLAHVLRDKNVRIFTSSLKIAMLLSESRPRVYMLGGEIRGSEPSLVGPMALGQLETFRFDSFFMGASGLSEDGLYDYSLEDTEIKRAMMARAARTIALVDSSKFERLSIVKIADLEQLDMLITDASPEGALADGLEAAGVEVRVAAP
ncbi:MAG: DeoR/GlpR family DNA-binding transcription regulator [Azospirillaceae bacterium]